MKIDPQTSRLQVYQKEFFVKFKKSISLCKIYSLSEVHVIEPMSYFHLYTNERNECIIIKAGSDL